VLEKPLGSDFESANEINEAVAGSFSEDQIYRIDHYLGKEAVQNLMVLRFANSIFEPLWCASHIEHVEITLAENVGVTGRGGYYDRSGAMRDMVQSHLLQLLALVAMEPPANLEPESVRNEKLKVLRSLRPVTDQQIDCDTVRGQYTAGVINGEEVRGYLNEEGIPAESSTETFVAIRAYVDSWRWAGVPFFLRTGKRLPAQQSHIVVRFKSVPHMIFEKHSDDTGYNSLVITLQPDEGIKLFLTAKVPGKGMNLRHVALDLDFNNVFRRRSWNAYERLLLDAIRCDSTLFVRRDEIEAAWNWTDPIVDSWKNSPNPVKPYAAGTWGPGRAKELVEELGFCWDE
jgi:glucose-6-phosphate 1-dehydrogenase